MTKATRCEDGEWTSAMPVSCRHGNRPIVTCRCKSERGRKLRALLRDRQLFFISAWYLSLQAGARPRDRFGGGSARLRGTNDQSSE
jgi:hypothetical protein